MDGSLHAGKLLPVGGRALDAWGLGGSSPNRLSGSHVASPPPADGEPRAAAYIIRQMSRTVRAGESAAAAFVAIVVAWSIHAGRDSLHVHDGHGEALAHHHAYLGHHQHDDFPEAPDPEDGEEREGGRETVSSLESGTLLLPGTSALAPAEMVRSGLPHLMTLPSAKLEPRPSAGPRAPPC